MTTPYIHHVTLTTGHTHRSTRAEVADAALAVIAPWLQSAIAVGAPLPLPAEPLAHYSASALLANGALVVTIYGPIGPHIPGQPHTGQTVPLVTLGVAQRSRQGGDLWAMFVGQFGVKDGLICPPGPWCAVALHPGLNVHMTATDWLGDLERCIAWAWITRNPAIEAKK